MIFQVKFHTNTGGKLFMNMLKYLKIFIRVKKHKNPLKLEVEYAIAIRCF